MKLKQAYGIRNSILQVHDEKKANTRRFHWFRNFSDDIAILR